VTPCLFCLLHRSPSFIFSVHRFVFLPFASVTIPCSTVSPLSFIFSVHNSVFLAFTILYFYRSFAHHSAQHRFSPPSFVFCVHNSVFLPFILPTIPLSTVHNSVFLPFVCPSLCTAPFTSHKNTFTFYYSPFVCPPFPSAPFTVHRFISLAFTLLYF